MSRRHHHRGRVTPRRSRVDRRKAEAAARVDALLMGCTCEPDIYLRHGDIDHVRIEHDRDCPARTARSAIAVFIPPRSTQ
jgi:hypothetical protein